MTFDENRDLKCISSDEEQTYYKIPPGEYTVTLYALGYDNWQGQVSVPPDGTKVLRPSPNPQSHPTATVVIGSVPQGAQVTINPGSANPLTGTTPFYAQLCGYPHIIGCGGETFAYQVKNGTTSIARTGDVQYMSGTAGSCRPCEGRLSPCYVDVRGQSAAPRGEPRQPVLRGPSNQRVVKNGSVILRIEAQPREGVTYRWFEGESGDTSRPIYLATEERYVTPPLKEATKYWVRVYRGYDSRDSRTATIAFESVGPELLFAKGKKVSPGSAATLKGRGFNADDPEENRVYLDELEARVTGARQKLRKGGASYATPASDSGGGKRCWGSKVSERYGAEDRSYARRGPGGRRLPFRPDPHYSEAKDGSEYRTAVSRRGRKHMLTGTKLGERLAETLSGVWRVFRTQEASLKSDPRANSCLHWLRGAGTAGVLILVLATSGWGVAAECNDWNDLRTQPSVTPPSPDDPEEDLAAGERAKTAIGWAVGLNSGGYGTILHTTDGGQTWERQGSPEELGDGNLTGVAVVDAREVWAAGNIGNDGLLLHTRDGGEHWYPEGDAEDLSGNGLVSVFAVDLYTAWAVGGNGLILHTTDGGDRWVRQGVGQVPPVFLQGVYAADASHAWAVGPEEEGNKYGTILYTADGGETWTKVPYVVTHTPPPTAYYLITVHGASAKEVWAVGRDQVIHVSIKSDGIHATDRTPDFGAGYDINGIFAVNRKTVWTVADNSTIWRSVNGGRGWKKHSPQGAGLVFRVFALNKKHAWATTGDQNGHGQVLYTANGGKSWTSQALPANPQMWGVSFVK